MAEFLCPPWQSHTIVIARQSHTIVIARGDGEELSFWLNFYAPRGNLFLTINIYEIASANLTTNPKI
ncbi:MAG: hypothetical protein F6K35_34000 [Okeania sp. SIO2H7]|nr:hypothetical protein [Okeania sp. SIO2H7]